MMVGCPLGVCVYMSVCACVKNQDDGCNSVIETLYMHTVMHIKKEQGFDSAIATTSCRCLGCWQTISI